MIIQNAMDISDETPPIIPAAFSMFMDSSPCASLVNQEKCIKTEICEWSSDTNYCYPKTPENVNKDKEGQTGNDRVHVSGKSSGRFPHAWINRNEEV